MCLLFATHLCNGLINLCRNHRRRFTVFSFAEQGFPLKFLRRRHKNASLWVRSMSFFAVCAARNPLSGMQQENAYSLYIHGLECGFERAGMPCLVARGRGPRAKKALAEALFCPRAPALGPRQFHFTVQTCSRHMLNNPLTPPHKNVNLCMNIRSLRVPSTMMTRLPRR